MKERPILFKGDMVRAILDGRKTQTRRVIDCALNTWHIKKLLGDWGLSEEGECIDGVFDYDYQTEVDDCSSDSVKCPYGKPGDRLWVRENLTWESYASKGFSDVSYEADNTNVEAEIPEKWCPPINHTQTHFEEGTNISWSTGFVPSIFMPRWASRILLEITDIRVERVRDISEKDCFAEGIKTSIFCPACEGKEDGCCCCDHTGRVRIGSGSFVSAEHEFHTLWDSINKKRGYGWDVNPWCWVVEFKRLKETT